MPLLLFLFLITKLQWVKGAGDVFEVPDDVQNESLSERRAVHVVNCSLGL